jgi:hypothetical protein
LNWSTRRQLNGRVWFGGWGEMPARPAGISDGWAKFVDFCPDFHCSPPIREFDHQRMTNIFISPPETNKIAFLQKPKFLGLYIFVL